MVRDLSVLREERVDCPAVVGYVAVSLWFCCCVARRYDMQGDSAVSLRGGGGSVSVSLLFQGDEVVVVDLLIRCLDWCIVVRVASLAAGNVDGEGLVWGIVQSR